MTHKEALADVDAILKAENTTWQEKKNMLADHIVRLANQYSDREDNFNFD